MKVMRSMVDICRECIDVRREWNANILRFSWIAVKLGGFMIGRTAQVNRRFTASGGEGVQGANISGLADCERRERLEMLEEDGAMGPLRVLDAKAHHSTVAGSRYNPKLKTGRLERKETVTMYVVRTVLELLLRCSSAGMLLLEEMLLLSSFSRSFSLLQLAASSSVCCCLAAAAVAFNSCRLITHHLSPPPRWCCGVEPWRVLAPEGVLPLGALVEANPHCESSKKSSEPGI